MDDNQRDAFREQLKWFSEHFQWCSLTDGLRMVAAGLLDRPLLSLTFDDADETVYRNVLPVLNDLAIPACVYVVPAYVLHGTSFRDAKPRRIMSWSQLAEWLRSGHEVGSHTYTHANLRCCNPDRIRQEFLWSKEAIEETLDTSVIHFAYPWGDYNRTSQRLLRDLCCYRSVATSQRGRMKSGLDPLLLRRDKIDLFRTGAEIGRFLQFADRFYWLRLFRHRRLLDDLKKRFAFISSGLSEKITDREQMLRWVEELPSH